MAIGRWRIAKWLQALKFSGYDYRFEMGTEGHNAKHGGAILPEMLRWTWCDYPGVVATDAKGGQ